eukprot:7762817-Alexandrium_andersonii.AAC.1
MRGRSSATGGSSAAPPLNSAHMRRARKLASSASVNDWTSESFEERATRVKPQLRHEMMERSLVSPFKTAFGPMTVSMPPVDSPLG